MISVWFEFLSRVDDTIRLTPTMELSKFVFPTKRQFESTIRPKTIEDLIREFEEEKSGIHVEKDESDVQRFRTS